jgi:dolichyl-phosphate beta-glucosyltransferase
MTDPEISLIFPAFNESEVIEGTIEQATSYLERRGFSFEIIVAADGTDGTREVAQRLSSRDPRIRVIGHRERCGKGRGVREAVAIANGQIIGFADADNKVPFEEFDKIITALCDDHPIVIGSRALRASRVERAQPWYRRIGARLFTVGLHVIVGVFASDTQCGFKFFTREVAKTIFQIQRIDGYMFDVEVLAIANALGYRIVEVPVRWRDDGDSRLELLRGNLQNAVDLFRIRWLLSKVGFLRDREAATKGGPERSADGE